MAKLIKSADLPAYLRKKQGDMTDQQFADAVGMTRVSVRALKAGRYLPKIQSLPKLGLSLEYRVIETAKK